ncbi:MAG: CDP-alcohol phosphatidyltransferase family protein [archaeon]
MNKGSLSWAITSFRVVALPFLVYSVNQEIIALTYLLFLFAVFSDFLDGYVAKKFETASQLGSYFDVIADFVFVFVMFLVFVNKGLYPVWIVLLICLVFGQFILSSLYLKRTTYDPIGKYYGSLMYGGIGLTLLFSEQIVYSIVTLGIGVSTVISLATRAGYFMHSKKEK